MTGIFWIILWTGFLLLRENGHLTQYEGGYTDYTEALARKGGGSI